MLLDERVARSSCRLSQLGSDAPAVTTASGLFPGSPVCAFGWGQETLVRRYSPLASRGRVHLSAHAAGAAIRGAPDRAWTTSGQPPAALAGKLRTAPAGEPRPYSAFVVRSYPVLSVGD